MMYKSASKPPKSVLINNNANNNFYNNNCDDLASVVAQDLALSDEEDEVGPGQAGPSLHDAVMKISSRE